jgi:hypothetical protein
MDCETITKSIIDLRNDSPSSLDFMNIHRLSKVKSFRDSLAEKLLPIYAGVEMLQHGVSFRHMIALKHGFDYVGGFSDGRAWAKRNDDFYLVSRDGKARRTFAGIERAWDFYKGSAFVKLQVEGKYGPKDSYMLIGKDGHPIPGAIYEDFDEKHMRQDMYLVKSKVGTEREYYYVYPDGSQASPERYSKATPFSDGRAWIWNTTENKVDLVNEKFESLYSISYPDEISAYSEGVCLVMYGHTTQAFDRNGGLLFSLNRVSVSDFKGGLCRVRNQTDGKFVYVRKSGNSMMKVYKRAEEYSYGLAKVQGDDDLYYFIDRDGNPVTDQRYEGCSSYEKGIAAVTKDGKWYFIGLDGEKLLGGETFDLATPFRDDVAFVVKNKQAYYIDRSGRRVFVKNKTTPIIQADGSVRKS